MVTMVVDSAPLTAMYSQQLSYLNRAMSDLQQFVYRNHVLSIRRSLHAHHTPDSVQ
jgi:hypothetical protein